METRFCVFPKKKLDLGDFWEALGDALRILGPPDCSKRRCKKFPQKLIMGDIKKRLQGVKQGGTAAVPSK